MAKAQTSIHIDRPPEAVFAIVGDAANNPRWRKRVTRTEWLDAGPMRVGRRGRQVSRMLGREWIVEAVVDEWDPPRRVAWRTVAGPLDVRSFYELAADGDGTLLTGGGEGRIRGRFGPMLTRLAVPGFERQARADVEALRDYLERAVLDGADGPS